MPKASDVIVTKGAEWHHLEPITAGRMTEIWKVAHEKGYTSLAKFWEYAHNERWDFYDILKMAYGK